MGRLRFLKGVGESLARQVACVLAAGSAGRPVDLGGTLVLVQTAGAARRIRRELAELGVLSPEFAQPMQALLPRGELLAGRFEREAAWARVIGAEQPDGLAPLFDEHSLPASPGERLKAGGVVCDLCDLLAEAGLTPATLHLPGDADAYDDSSRWTVLKRLHAKYLALLGGRGLGDPNEARLAQMERPRTGVRRVVVACVPDLPLAAQNFAGALEARGVPVEILVWQPGGESAGGFDAWGRPLPGEWADCRIGLEESQVRVANESADQAKAALDFVLGSGEPGDYAVILADASLGGVFQAEVLARGGKPFLPEGERLAASEAGVLALLWGDFQRGRDLRVLRRLCELPAFAGLVDGNCKGDGGLPPSTLLATCDHLIGAGLAVTLDDAEALAATEVPARADGRPVDPDAAHHRANAGKLVATVGAMLGGHHATGPADIVAGAWRNGGEGLAEARRVAELAALMAASPVLGDWPEGEASVFTRALRAESTHEASAPGDVELSGWLEAPWVEAGRLALCGVAEGALPSALSGHPFLPDSLRGALGLADNAARLARDAHLLDCLTRSRPAGDFHCFTAKFGAQGEPLRPSSLLMRCERDALPRRILHLVAKAESLRSRAARRPVMKWSLRPEDRRTLEKLSPTDFESCLACPFRFYLGKVLRLDTFPADAREMDARAFGNMIHEALEAFGREAIAMGDGMLSLGGQDILDIALEKLDAAARWRFGPKPPPAVRIQIESARMRLGAFARLQAAEFAGGWLIRAVERKLDADGPGSLMIGPLKLSGKIDRIDEHPGMGAWRVMDYKTFTSGKGPAETHLGPAIRAWLPEAVVDIHNGKSLKRRAWTNLQLPLYRMIAAHWHGGEPGGDNPAVGYFVLPSDPNDTAIEMFGELDDERNPAACDSALACAAAVAERVAGGVFWPPQPWRGGWDDPVSALLGHGEPDACIDPETIAWLKGGAR